MAHSLLRMAGCPLGSCTGGGKCAIQVHPAGHLHNVMASLHDAPPATAPNLNLPQACERSVPEPTDAASSAWLQTTAPSPALPSTAIGGARRFSTHTIMQSALTTRSKNPAKLCHHLAKLCPTSSTTASTAKARTLDGHVKTR
ncbi:hypothetical protein SEVIR_1G238267v4 [Setaria viridis]